MHFITSKLDFSNPPLYFQSNQITTMEFPSLFFSFIRYFLPQMQTVSQSRDKHDLQRNSCIMCFKTNLNQGNPNLLYSNVSTFSKLMVQKHELKSISTEYSEETEILKIKYLPITQEFLLALTVLLQWSLVKKFI